MAVDKGFSVDALRDPMVATYKSQVNLSYEWRLKQLQTLKKMISTHYEEWIHALYQDLGKSRVEAISSELIMVENEIDYQIANFKDWMKPKHVPTPAFLAIAFQQVKQKPLRAPGVLLIGPFNYPFHLCFLPAAGSLAAGNPTLIKPSELCPATSALMEKLVKQYFDPGALQVVQGGVEETQSLLEKEWGTILFTGSERVGRIVAAAAAKTLTPVILELGGKSPVYVDETAPDLRFTAERIIWGKTVNTGQTCVAPDYLLVHEKRADQLCEELVKAVTRQFGDDPQSSELGRIVSVGHARRLVSMLEEVEGKGELLYGGSKLCNAASRFVHPSFVLNPPRSSKVLREEIFGPILPIVVVKSKEEAIEFIQQMPGIPLVLDVFTKSQKVFEEVTNSCPSAASTRNEAFGFQTSSPFLPVGGLGSSGYGSYHGRYSLDAFSHAHATVYRPCGPGFEAGMVRYHPFTPTKAKIILGYVLKLPPIPVLHSRFVLGVIAAAAVVKFLVPATSMNLMSNVIATSLEGIAGWLRNN